MSDARCTALLQWALPRLGLRWTGFRNVRGQVCKRIRRRVAELGLSDLDAYRVRLETDPSEWAVLDGLCVITISRFYRDHAVWTALREEVLPTLAEAALAAGEEELRCWSLGCASGEEPYSLSILWERVLAPRFPGLRLRVLATDLDPQVLQRARAATYDSGSLQELPGGWREAAFSPVEGGFQVRERFRSAVEFRSSDVRQALPDEQFRLLLCRNVIFTYFDEALQRQMLERLLPRLAPGAALVVGRHERERQVLKEALDAWHPALGIFRHGSG